METGERLKGNEPGINTFPHQDGCDLGKRLKKGPVCEVMRLMALVPAMRPKAMVLIQIEIRFPKYLAIMMIFCNSEKPR